VISMTIENDQAQAGIEAISEIEYHLVIAEFDALWGRPHSDANRRRMDYMICVIAAFEESRGKPSAS
jgi:cytochrome c peroxidase